MSYYINDTMSISPYAFRTGIAIFGATYALGAVAIFIARAVFYHRDAVKE